MSDRYLDEQIEALRREAAEARCLAATMTDRQAVTDLILYADALGEELARLLDTVAEAGFEAPVPPTLGSFVTRLTIEHI